jgi:hypothetical protein
MIDIETLSTRTNAFILTIGAIRFNRNEKIYDINNKNLPKFYYKIDKSSCEKLNFHIDSETKKWWTYQSKEAQHEVFYSEENRLPIKDILIKLVDFCKDCKTFWSHSPNFDYVILENAFRECNIDAPWKFWNLRDTRTMYDISGINLKKYRSSGGGVEHHSLHDCYSQVLALQDSFNNILKKNKL